MYICPVCKNKLERQDNSWRCPEGHCFDIARKGYVNLLTTVGRNPKNSGDNAEMVKARTEVLNRDYYLPLAEKTGEILAEELRDTSDPAIIDSGCGEGYYTVKYAAMVPKARFFGIDISKNAISHCMTRVHQKGIKNCSFAVASSFELPFEDGFADIIVCTFAPVTDREYAAKLKQTGSLIVVSPSPGHLFELKAAVYDEPYLNRPNDYGLESFYLADEQVFEYKKKLESSEDICSLFSMTPYFYKTSAKGMERLRALQSIEVTCGFVIQTYKLK